MQGDGKKKGRGGSPPRWEVLRNLLRGEGILEAVMPLSGQSRKERAFQRDWGLGQQGSTEE